MGIAAGVSHSRDCNKRGPLLNFLTHEAAREKQKPKQKMKNTLKLIALSCALTVNLNAGLLVQTEPDVEKNAWVGESQDIKFPKTDYVKTNGIVETWQWFNFNVGPMPGETNRVIELASVTPADAGYYFVQASDGTTTEFSALIALTVKEPATLINQLYHPDGEGILFANIGDPFEIKVTLTDFGQDQRDNHLLSFQWYRLDSVGNKTAIAGATHRKYSVASAQIADVGRYTVVVTDGTTTEEFIQPYSLTVQ